jgi:hypothetical protein
MAMRQAASNERRLDPRGDDRKRLRAAQVVSLVTACRIRRSCRLARGARKSLAPPSRDRSQPAKPARFRRKPAGLVHVNHHLVAVASGAGRLVARQVAVGQRYQLTELYASVILAT